MKNCHCEFQLAMAVIGNAFVNCPDVAISLQQREHKISSTYVFRSFHDVAQCKLS